MTQPGSCILVGEDDPATAEILTMVLECAGYQVQVRSTAADVCAALEAQNFDAALLDMMLSPTTTQEFIGMLAKVPRLPPVIIHSGRPHAELKVLESRLNAAAVLQKPASIDALLGSVAVARKSA